MAKRPTGPGKVQDNLTSTPEPLTTELHSALARTQPTRTLTPERRPSATFLPRTPNSRANGSSQTQGLLYNFDIEGDELKDEHRRWLDDHVVPPLTAQSARVRLLGTSSRTGAAQFNQALSARRVESVRTYLVAQGVEGGRIETAAAGETLAAVAGQADGTDRAEDRAVGCQLTQSRAAIKGTPKVARYFDNLWDNHTLDGIDLEGVPVLHLPAGRIAHLKVLNAPGFDIVMARPQLAQVYRVPLAGNGQTNGDLKNLFGPLRGDVDPLFIAIHAPTGGQGETYLAARTETDDIILLRVVVLPPLTVRVKFWRVMQDAHDNRTFRSIESINNMFNRAAETWTLQANVSFENLGIQEVKFPQSGGHNREPLTVFDTGGMKLDFIPFGEHGKRFPNQVNVYLVKAFRTLSTKPGASLQDAGGVTIANGSNVILIKDDTREYNDDGLVLAHEFGHAFGAEHFGIDPLYLMPSRLIPKQYKLRGLQQDAVATFLQTKAPYVTRR